MLITKQTTKDANTSATARNTGCVSFKYKFTTDVSFSVIILVITLCMSCWWLLNVRKKFLSIS